MSIPFLQLCLSEDNVEEVKKEVVGVLRPYWVFEDTFTEENKTGFLNLTLMCYADRGKDPTDAIVIKNVKEPFCGQIHQYHRTCTFLNQNNIGPKMLAFFENGVVMEFIDGEGFQWESPRTYDDDYREKLAEEAARWHCQDTLKKAKEFGIRKTDVFCCDYMKYWEEIFSTEPFIKYKDQYPTLETLISELEDFTQKSIAKGDLQEALCHFDFNCGNIFLNVKNNKGIQIVDFDFTGLCYLQFELITIFRFFKEVTEPQSDHIPGEEYEMKFLSHYLSKRNELDGLPEPTSKEVQTLWRQIQRCRPYISLRAIVVSTFIMYFNPDKDRPDVVADEKSSGALFWMPKAVWLWEGYNEYRNRILREYD